MIRSAPPDPMLAAALRRLRAERGITREALALRCGITPCGLARIEHGQAVPGWNTVRRIARGLDLGMVELCVAVEGRSPSALASRIEGRPARYSHGAGHLALAPIGPARGPDRPPKAGGASER